jgi:hypothetical protein
VGLLARFEHLHLFAWWLALTLVLGFALFYAWDRLYRSWQRKQALRETATRKSDQ